MPPPPKRVRGLGPKVPVISLVDCKRQRSTLLLSQAPMAKLYNNPYLSDIAIKVGSSCYYGHKLVLSAASDVFAKMFDPTWADPNQSSVELHEDSDAQKVFDKFLKYLYCGKILVPRDMLFTMYLLADKYNVESLLHECVSNLEKGLTVRLELKEISRDERLAVLHGPQCTRECCRLPEVTGFDLDVQPSTSSNSEPPEVTVIVKTKIKTLVPNVTFPINTVIKMLNIVNNRRIYEAALYNLTTRLADHIMNENYRIWSAIQPDLMLKILSDNHFYCPEYIIFKAVKVWLCANEDHMDTETVKNILGKTRFGIMSPSELYDVESDKYLIGFPEIQDTIREAVRYKVFRDCPRAMERENWSGEQFTSRTPREETLKCTTPKKTGTGQSNISF